MKSIKTLLGVAVIGVALGLTTAPAMAAEGVISSFKIETTPGYGHMQFPAIDEDTLWSRRPVLLDASTTDVIDFYGPCDYDPLGKEALLRQRAEWFDKEDDNEEAD